MVDTNTISLIANGRSIAARHKMSHARRLHSIATSAIVEGEILYGIARKPEAVRIRRSMEALLSDLSILPWDSTAARVYGIVRAELVGVGKPLSTIDMLIAAHAISIEAVLVTHDNAFKQVEGLRTVDWATDL